ncbi:hypothetical protein [Bacillus tuaregi]|uniref:hypothetical protein n=1 Tax=Bacillus tuaregi TaxID=1816695 RepID=UPI0008F8B265|nr:hypothetical protein [Bacillus tuaregi]
MDIQKEDLHLLVDLVDDKDTRLVYDLIRAVIDQNDREMLEIYHTTPSPDLEEKIYRPANHDFNSDDLIDWEDSCLNMV